MELVSSDQVESSDARLALQLAEEAMDITAECDLGPSATVYHALSSAQYATRDYKKCIATCETWLSSPPIGGDFEACLLLAAAWQALGKSGQARDLLVVADTTWLGASIGSRERGEKLWNDVLKALQAAGEDVDIKVPLEVKADIFKRVLERVPRAHGVRRYLGYLYTQLGRWQDADRQFSLVLEMDGQSPFALSCKALMDMYYGRTATSPTTPQDLKSRFARITRAGQAKPTVAITMMLSDPKGAVADQDLYLKVPGDSVAGSLVAYRQGRIDQSQRHLRTASRAAPAREVLAEILQALLDFERGEISLARGSLASAEEAIERLAPRDGVARENSEVGYFTSAVWLEPILLLREAKLKIETDVSTR
jgi:tetratricopeptide (TPR) repeat protein